MELEYLRERIKELTNECLDIELLYLIRELLVKDGQ
jgi:hypothetical protein